MYLMLNDFQDWVRTLLHRNKAISVAGPNITV